MPYRVARGREGGVTVRIGSAPVREARRVLNGLCIVGICAEDAPWYAQLYPHALVRDTRFRQRSAAVEHVRLKARDDVGRLPGLDGREPSLLRDAVLLALTAGAPDVDVILVRSKGLKPWDADHPEFLELVEPFLTELLGATLVLPDAGGPPPVGPGTGEPAHRRAERLVRTANRLSELLRSRYQVALLDSVPGLSQEDFLDLLRGLVGQDVGLCGWTGPEARLAVHGWRSAAAVVGSLLSSDGREIGRGLSGRTVELPPGRRVAPARRASLALHQPPPPPREGEESLVRLELHRRRDRAEVQGERSFRQPVGEWPLPALRAVKLIHHLLVYEAERFVFRTADEAQAMALAAALQRVLRPYVARGLLTGAGGTGQPRIRGGVDSDPSQPSLYAVLSAQLRPWSQNVVVRVVVRPGNQPVLEVP